MNLTVFKDQPVAYNLSLRKFIFLSDSRYTVKLAGSPAEIDEILKLRFEVFNIELHEGLESSYSTLRDEDQFDPVCHHLLVTEKCSGRIIGTYRLQTFEMARHGKGFYSATEFNLSQLGRRVIRRSVELGRACIARDHRNGRVLFLLWRAIAQYMKISQKRFLFGCCSLSSQDPHEGKALMDYLQRECLVSDSVQVDPMPGFACYPPHFLTMNRNEGKMPPLMDIYIRHGARVCGPPAIDRDFGTIDYLILLDLENLAPETRNLFF
jgi:putative hemolysin